MKQKRSPSRILPLALAFSLLAAAQSQAAVVITNLQLSTTSISFDISGTMPTAVPSLQRDGIFVTNPNIFASPGFALNSSFTVAPSWSFSGSQTLSNVVLGAPSFGDYAVLNWSSPLAANETIMGTVTATWATPLLNPAAVTSVAIYWGSENDVAAPNTGTLLGNAAVVAVPEPTGAALLVCSLAAVAGRRRRR